MTHIELAEIGRHPGEMSENVCPTPSVSFLLQPYGICPSPTSQVITHALSSALSKYLLKKVPTIDV